MEDLPRVYAKALADGKRVMCVVANACMKYNGKKETFFCDKVGLANWMMNWSKLAIAPKIPTSSGINEFNEANFKIALNLEYRYPIIGPVKGAFFIDAGNIWNVNNNVPDSSQSLNSYRDLNQLAVGTGFGLRYDFDYFIFRLDTAFKTFDPSQAPQDRWGSQIALDKAVFNVGINYPF